MKTLKTQNTPQVPCRRGSTLIIVIALLGLLAFMGMIFFSFASQERAAAEFFSEAAKGEIDEPDNVWDHPLRHIISGTSNRPAERGSILRSRDRRLSIVANMVGSDLAPHSGEGVAVSYVGGLPVVTGPVGNDWLNFVDSPAARGGNEDRPVTPPAADVDYTYPDINNLFLAYKGWAIRDNGIAAVPRFERVPVIIPSFVRPQYMKQIATANGFMGNTAPTDIDWASAFDGVNRATSKLGGRSFRPHPTHIAGFMPDGTTPVFRFLTAAENALLATPLVSGGFPFLPDDNLIGQPGGLNGIQGEMGIWTGSEPDAYELDADNDNDGIREGIWIDTHFPVQEDPSGKLYTVLHSFTIYDLDGLINLNVHGNLAGLDRSGNVQAIAGSGLMNEEFLSKSNMGLGPNEVNPLWAMRTNLGTAFSADAATSFQYHFGHLPATELEQANMEWLWLMAGRAQVDVFPPTKLDDLHPGRWGENERLFNAYKLGGTFAVADLPRPGRPGNAQATGSSGIRYGGVGTGGSGRDGFDDNQDRLDGELNPSLGRVTSFGTPMDYAGTGRTHTGTQGVYTAATGTFPLTGDMRLPLVHHDTSTYGPERYLGFNGYSLKRDVDLGLRYIFGQNNTYDNGTGDDLIANPFYDAPFEDPLESIFDPDLAERDVDRIFGPQDLLALHLTSADIASSPNEISLRLQELSPYALDDSNAPFQFNEQTTPGVRSRFTTVSNSLHRFMMRSPFGADGRPGDTGVDDDGDGFTDEPDEVLAVYGDSDTTHRFWEFTADTDGADPDGDGFPNGDGLFEFPPAFGAAMPYSATDPFRPQVRRMLTMESGEGRSLIGQMPISPNHILDVERNSQTPAEGTPQFLQYMQRAGMRFRPLIDHPLATESIAVTSPLPIWPVAFPPQNPADREFWARRDRQKLARDIYVLLYTTGGAGQNAVGTTLNYTTDNVPGEPAATEGAPVLYTHDQLRRMAQFAVNLVDAMDSDNVMSKFEYDKNLGSGWNMDDDPYATAAAGEGVVSTNATVTGNGLYPEDGTERGVVWGVEAQELAISETQGIHSNSPSADHVSTPFPDASMARDFLYVELQNLRPMPLALGQSNSLTADTAVWRLGRYDRDAADTPPAPASPVGNAAAPDEEIAILQHAQNVVDGGGRFSISVASDAGLASSAFFVDTGDAVAGTFDGTYELIAPDAPDVTLPTTANTNGSMDPGYVPLTDIDVIHDDHNGVIGAARFDAPSGNFLETLVPYAGNDHFQTAASTTNTFNLSPTPFGFDLVLQRRANPNLPQLNETENPWVEVDRIRATFAQFNIQDGDLPATIFDPTGPTGYLTSIESTERVEPLDDTERISALAKTTSLYRKNTVKAAAAVVKDDLFGVNSSSLPVPTLPVSMTNPANAFELWQVHFDREYASSGEFLSLPLVGPNLLTQRLNRMRYPGYQQSFPDAFGATGTQSTSLLSSAEAMLLWPNFTDDGSTLEVNTARDNRWYRLFQFVEVESRVHRMLGNYLTQTKIPGKINVNMIRHREVLAGLIDNPYLADVPNLNNVGDLNAEDAPFMTSSALVGPGRDLYRDFISDRDGNSVTSFNPAAASSRQFWIPGTPNAKPFRSFGSVGTTSASDSNIDRTILRRMVSDRDDDANGVSDDAGDLPGTNRHWLELSSQSFHQQPGDTNDSDTEDSADNNGNTSMQRHQILSKVMNNTTTVSNSFIVYGTAAYFEVHEDTASGLFQVGGRFDLDGDGDETNDQQRAVFVIDRTDAFEAYDPGTGDFDWNRLVKARATIE